ncbi:MAG: glycosyltransferase family 2 protein [Patescibacteria group bacterium]|nr:glycosyltransferase family 2 protein [Patescibacteria group bacterium]
MEVSIVIPAFNEEKGIGLVLDNLKETLKGTKIRYEIIVVDDGSSDKSAKIARQKKAKVIIHPKNSGYGAALQTGMKVAKYRYVAITDADGSYPVEKIPEMLKLMDKGFDLIIGARTGKFYRYLWLKQPVRYIFKLIAEFVTGVAIPDPNSGLRVYRKSAILPFLNYRTCRGFSFSTSTTIIFLLEGKLVEFVPILYLPRKGKSKVKFIRDALRAGQILAETIVYYNPFKLFFLITLIFLAVMLIFLIGYFFTKSSLVLLFIALFFFSAILSFYLGLTLSLFKKGNVHEN